MLQYKAYHNTVLLQKNDAYSQSLNKPHPQKIIVLCETFHIVSSCFSVIMALTRYACLRLRCPSPRASLADTTVAMKNPGPAETQRLVGLLEDALGREERLWKVPIFKNGRIVVSLMLFDILYPWRWVLSLNASM